MQANIVIQKRYRNYQVKPDELMHLIDCKLLQALCYISDKTHSLLYSEN